MKIRETYGDKVRWVFKDFPLPSHAEAFKASEAAHCAGEQGKYWEMPSHSRLSRPSSTKNSRADRATDETQIKQKLSVFYLCLYLINI